MKFRSITLGLTLTLAVAATAQLASSHAPAVQKQSAAAVHTEALASKPAVKVNGAVLTELELRREMVTIFPYAQQHNNTFPKELEPDIRKGALDMLIFEELLYQEAKRLNVTVSADKLASSERAFRKQLDKASYDHFLRTECNGSQAVLKEKIRRSLLIEKMLKSQVKDKSVVTVADAKSYYDKNSKQYEHGDIVSIQTISIIPPEGATKEINEEAYYKIKDGLRLAKETKNEQEFGLLAESISDDDWRTHMGKRNPMDMAALPPEVAKAIRGMKVGQISEIIQIGRAYVIVRLNAFTPAGKTPFSEVKAKIMSEMQAQRILETRSALNRKLRQNATIEVL